MKEYIVIQILMQVILHFSIALVWVITKLGMS